MPSTGPRSRAGPLAGAAILEHNALAAPLDRPERRSRAASSETGHELNPRRSMTPVIRLPDAPSVGPGLCPTLSAVERQHMEPVKATPASGLAWALRMG
jgi:hypothetical protein